MPDTTPAPETLAEALTDEERAIVAASPVTVIAGIAAAKTMLEVFTALMTESGGDPTAVSEDRQAELLERALGAGVSMGAANSYEEVNQRLQRFRSNPLRSILGALAPDVDKGFEKGLTAVAEQLRKLALAYADEMRTSSTAKKEPTPEDEEK